VKNIALIVHKFLAENLIFENRDRMVLNFVSVSPNAGLLLDHDLIVQCTPICLPNQMHIFIFVKFHPCFATHSPYRYYLKLAVDKLSMHANSTSDLI